MDELFYFILRKSRFVVLRNTLGMDGMYWSDRGLVWVVHIGLSVCPTISCVGTSVRIIPMAGQYTSTDQ